jgi:hypothetical protein
VDPEGDLDAVVTNTNSNNASVLRNTGYRDFAAPVNYAVGALSSSVALGDLDSDGDLDMLVANFNAAFIIVVRNMLPRPCPADFNRYGTLDYFDSLDFVLVYDEGCPPSLPEVDPSSAECTRVNSLLDRGVSSHLQRPRSDAICAPRNFTAAQPGAGVSGILMAVG